MTTIATSPETSLLRAIRIALAALVLVLVGGAPASAQVAATPHELEHVGVTEHLDGPMPLDVPFRDHLGNPTSLGKILDGKKPLVLQFAYHSCPVVCSMITNNLDAGLKGIPWTLGQEYDAVTISIDPNESLERTANKRAGILAEYGRGLPASPASPSRGWHFLVGSPASIAAVTKAAGFEYEYDERQKQWGHPSVVFILKPDGHLARYLYGLEFPSADLRLGLLEASEGRHISTVEQIILYCYHYDPQGGKYVLVAQRVMRVGGGAVAIVLFAFLGAFWARELRKKKTGGDKEGSDGGPSSARQHEKDDETRDTDGASSPNAERDALGVIEAPPSRGG